MAEITQNKQKALFSLWSLKKTQQKCISEYRGKISNKTNNNNNKIVVIAIIVVIIITILLLLIILTNNVNNNGNAIKESGHLIEEMLFKVMLESI